VFLPGPKLRADEEDDGNAEVVEPDGEVDKTLRDELDQQVLGTLRAAKADYLITGDKDLLALGGRYSIVTPAAFWERCGD